MKNNLKYRELTTKAKETLFSYFLLKEITFIEAHNELLKHGILLTENDELFDY